MGTKTPTRRDARVGASAPLVAPEQGDDGFPPELEAFLDAFVDMIVEDLIAHPPPEDGE